MPFALSNLLDNGNLAAPSFQQRPRLYRKIPGQVDTEQPVNIRSGQPGIVDAIILPGIRLFSCQGIIDCVFGGIITPQPIHRNFPFEVVPQKIADNNFSFSVWVTEIVDGFHVIPVQKLLDSLDTFFGILGTKLAFQIRFDAIDKFVPSRDTGQRIQTPLCLGFSLTQTTIREILLQISQNIQMAHTPRNQIVLALQILSLVVKRLPSNRACYLFGNIALLGYNEFQSPHLLRYSSPFTLTFSGPRILFNSEISKG